MKLLKYFILYYFLYFTTSANDLPSGIQQPFGGTEIVFHYFCYNKIISTCNVISIIINIPKNLTPVRQLTRL